MSETCSICLRKQVDVRGMLWVSVAQGIPGHAPSAQRDLRLAVSSELVSKIFVKRINVSTPRKYHWATSVIPPQRDSEQDPVSEWRQCSVKCRTSTYARYSDLSPGFLAVMNYLSGSIQQSN